PVQPRRGNMAAIRPPDGLLVNKLALERDPIPRPSFAAISTKARPRSWRVDGCAGRLSEPLQFHRKRAVSLPVPPPNRLRIRNTQNYAPNFMGHFSGLTRSVPNPMRTVSPAISTDAVSFAASESRGLSRSMRSLAVGVPA